jgi:DNA-binding transcriptional ArsR family regulator
MAGEDVKRDLRELREQIEALREAFDRVARPYSDLTGVVDQLRSMTGGYFRILDLIQRYGGVGPDLAVPGLKDDISRHIVAVLIERGDRNVSQVTDAVKARRGTASRRIVRRRLEELAREGVLVASREGRHRTFSVSGAVRERWSQVLGFPKYGDRREETHGR